MDKEKLPTFIQPEPTRFSQYRAYILPVLWITAILLRLASQFVWLDADPLFIGKDSRVILEKACPQAEYLTPTVNSDLAHDLFEIYASDNFRNKAAELLGGSVRVPSESFDDLGPVGEDPRWEIFGEFHAYLLGAFPNIHATLKQTKVNTYGLVYHWQGSDDTLKPILLAAHQDVVPVDPSTIDQWVHPPFSGYFDGEYVWGRGSSDDKSGLISIFATVELLIEKGFQPTRSVVIALGIDEEASGTQGAGEISKYLVEEYGVDSFSFILDEGSGYSSQYGTTVAGPGVAEKGYIDVRVEVSSPGGHSSIPPVHSSIGYLAAAIVHLEKHPYKAHLLRGTPFYGSLQCIGAYAPDVSDSFRKLVAKSIKHDKALKELEEHIFQGTEGIIAKALLGTTQAVDLINGGVKVNALPERASAVVNHRIAIESSVEAVTERITALLSPVAEKYHLSYSAFGEDITSLTPPTGTLTLSDAWNTALEPAPITPTDSAAYKLLSGTIRATAQNGRNKGNESDVIVAPGMSTGNTDTRYYWDLTRNIFRYAHLSSTDVYGGIHTVNEALKVDGLVEEIRFMTYIILNSDESTVI